ncbi:hypothetical protein Pst134EB_006071 [Puccinia striiformis f. sp. tritici]|nr:hypothetical protein Pst134EB_006071 [Puccinia striiformis f. sp. tritici]
MPLHLQLLPPLATSPEPRQLLATFLIDSGVTHNVLSESFTRRTGILNNARPTERVISGFDGSKSRASYEVSLRIDNEDEPSRFIVTQLKDSYDGILGMPWISKYKNLINWTEHCFRTETAHATATGEWHKGMKVSPPNVRTSGLDATVNKPLPSATVVSKTNSPNSNDRPRPDQDHITKQPDPPKEEQILQNSRTDGQWRRLKDSRTDNQWRRHKGVEVSPPNVRTSGLDAAVNKSLPSATVVSKTSIIRSDTTPTTPETTEDQRGKEQAELEVHKKRHKETEVSPPNVRTSGLDAAVNKSLPSATVVIKPPTSDLRDSTQTTVISAAKTLWSTSAQLAAEGKANTPTRSAQELVPHQYHRYLDMFQKKGAQQLLPSRKYNFRVELMPGAVPQTSRMIPLSPAEN